MCTADDIDDIDGEALMPKEENAVLDKSTLCVKCKANACLVLKGKDSYCRDCFLAHVDHKCRSSLGKSKQMRPDDKVLVGFSCSPSSAVLLHVLHSGKKQDNHKKLMYPIVFCYIDDGCVFDASLDDRKKNIQEIKEIVESYGFEFYLTTLTSADDDGLLISNLDEDSEKIVNFFKPLTQSSKEDLLSKLRQNALIKIARQLKCNKIFTAENQNSVAAKLLTKIALGMGEQLSQEVGFQDSRYKDLSILRPMSDLDNTSISYFVKFLNLKTIQRPAWKSQSIQKLTSGFINGLQEEFPSTVSTIYRTGTKCSGLLNDSSNSELICLLCKVAHIDNSQTLYSAEDAMAFTKSVSQVPNCNDCSCSKLNQELLKTFFCYSCLIIVNELESINQLPPDVLAELTKRKALNTMLKEIKDFLLE